LCFKLVKCFCNIPKLARSFAEHGLYPILKLTIYNEKTGRLLFCQSSYLIGALAPYLTLPNPTEFMSITEFIIHKTMSWGVVPSNIYELPFRGCSDLLSAASKFSDHFDKEKFTFIVQKIFVICDVYSVSSSVQLSCLCILILFSDNVKNNKLFTIWEGYIDQMYGVVFRILSMSPTPSKTVKDKTVKDLYEMMEKKCIFFLHLLLSTDSTLKDGQERIKKYFSSSSEQYKLVLNCGVQDEFTKKCLSIIHRVCCDPKFILEDKLVEAKEKMKKIESESDSLSTEILSLRQTIVELEDSLFETKNLLAAKQAKLEIIKQGKVQVQKIIDQLEQQIISKDELVADSDSSSPTQSFSPTSSFGHEDETEEGEGDEEEYSEDLSEGGHDSEYEGFQYSE